MIEHSSRIHFWDVNSCVEKRQLSLSTEGWSVLLEAPVPDDSHLLFINFKPDVRSNALKGDLRCPKLRNYRKPILNLFLFISVQIANLSHPFHLHGYSFHVMGMGRAADTNTSRMNLKDAIQLDKEGKLQRLLGKNDKPPKKDTLSVPNNGYTVVRFIAENPGFWLFHCHFLYHLVIGMSLVFQVGELTDLPPVPTNFPKCGDYVPPIN